MTIRRLVLGFTAVVFVLSGAGCAGTSQEAEVQAGDRGLTDTTVAIDTTSVPTTAVSTDQDEVGDGETPPTPVPCPVAELEALMASDPGDEPADVDIERMVRGFDGLANASPPEIAADLRMVRDALVTYLTALEAFPSPEEYPVSTAEIEQLEQAWNGLDTEALEAASARIESYFRAVCPDFPFPGDVDVEREFEPIGEAVN